MSTATHSVDLVARLQHLDDGGVGSAPITIRFTYDPAEPYGVELLFTAAGIRPPGVSWLVGRDLLITGAERACGEGDVRVTTYSLTDGDVTILTLSPPESEPAAFAVSTHDLIDFLERTEELVPLGTESHRAQRELDAIDWVGLTAGEGDL